MGVGIFMWSLIMFGLGVIVGFLYCLINKE
jgi:xanthosine utilization system XapX-like protein